VASDEWSTCLADGCGRSVRRKTKSGPWVHAIHDPTVVHDPIPAADPRWRPTAATSTDEAWRRLEACLGDAGRREVRS